MLCFDLFINWGDKDGIICIEFDLGFFFVLLFCRVFLFICVVVIFIEVVMEVMFE